MEHFTQALQLAQQAMPLSNPNPRVGCVIVSADGRIIGRGHTQRAGEAHAEIMALRDAASRGASVAGSTVYVTLEPCAHQGRTPPCCDALIAAGVGRVMVALADPNPLVAGQGLQRLRAAGIDVQLAGLDSAEARAARDINIGFLHRMQHAVPWVRLKTASSLDGRTALPNGQSQWITGDAARADVQHWRARACAILTGIGTVLHDDPLLNVRLPQVQRQPPLAILDSRLRTPPQARLFGVAARAIWIFTTASATEDPGGRQRADALQAAGAHIVCLPADNVGRPSLSALLQELGRRAINELHVEAGAALNGALLAQGHVDELLAYVAPLLLGPGQPLADLPAIPELSMAARWQLCESRALGDDIRLRLRTAPGNSYGHSTHG